MFGSCLDGLQMCVRCCQLFVAEAASDVSDVDPNGHVVRLSFVVIYGWFFLSVLWYLRLTIVCWLGSIRLLVSEMDPFSVHG